MRRLSSPLHSSMSFSFPETFYDTTVSSEEDTRTPSHTVHTSGGGLLHDTDSEATPVDAEKRLAAMDNGFLFARRQRRPYLARSFRKACRTGTDWSRGALPESRIAATPLSAPADGPSFSSSSSGVDRSSTTPSPCTERCSYSTNTSAGAYGPDKRRCH